MTPRSLAVCSGTSSLPIKVRLGVTNLECISLLPNAISLVLLGFNNKRLLEHHWPILCKSSLNPLSPMSDQHQISSCNINALENRVVMRITDMITQDEFA